MSTLTLKIEFSGGLELLFSNQRFHNVSVPSTISKFIKNEEEISTDEAVMPANVTFLLHWLKDNLLKEREELFLEGDTVYVP